MQNTNISVHRIPATTANIGPGYDCLGVAVRLYNKVAVRRDDEAVAENGMARTAADIFWKASGVAPFNFEWNVQGDVPRSRGMGSSVTVRLGLLLGLNALSNQPLERTALFELCAGLEGHPDNAAPAAFGGFTVAGGPRVARFAVSDALQFIFLIPGFEVATPDARKVLPATLPHRDAVASATNACRIVAAFAAQDYAMLRGSFGDHFHQTHRAHLIPFLNEVIAAGENAGALGGFLSGSGSTICCVTLENAAAVAAAMRAACPDPDARTVITTADNTGALEV